MLQFLHDPVFLVNCSSLSHHFFLNCVCTSLLVFVFNRVQVHIFQIMIFFFFSKCEKYNYFGCVPLHWKLAVCTSFLYFGSPFNCTFSLLISPLYENERTCESVSYQRLTFVICESAARKLAVTC